MTTDLFRISYSYLRRPACFKSKLYRLGSSWRVILPVNFTFSKTDMIPFAVSKATILEGEFSVIFPPLRLMAAPQRGDLHSGRWLDLLSSCSSSSAVSTAASSCDTVVSNSGIGLPSTTTSRLNSAKPDAPRAAPVYPSVRRSRRRPLVSSRLSR